MRLKTAVTKGMWAGKFLLQQNPFLTGGCQLVDVKRLLLLLLSRLSAWSSCGKEV